MKSTLIVAILLFGSLFAFAPHRANPSSGSPASDQGAILVGAPDPRRGIREFVVGTGGRNHRPFGEVKPNSEVRDATAFGVLKLTLKAGAYDWQFIPEAGKSFTDSGSGVCH